MNNPTIEKIKGRGYWRINFQPVTIKTLSLKDCEEIVRKNNVKLRGWDYPHFPQRSDETSGLGLTQNYCEGWINWWAHKEFWRMYKSGQFIHYTALIEDWFEEDGWFAELAKQVKPMTTLNVIGSVEYQTVEIFEFLSRLTASGLYDDGVNVSISLHNLQNRILRIEDNMRVPFHSERKTLAPEFTYEKKLSKFEIVGKTKELATELSLGIFEIFGWQAKSIVEQDIEGFLNGKR